MVHPEARRDPFESALHAIFIAARLICAAALGLFLPVYLALFGGLDARAAAFVAWLAAPLAVAYYLSRTGRLKPAYLISATTTAGLIVFVAGVSGGTASPFLLWFVIIPIEAALSASLLVVLVATSVAAVAVVVLVGLETAGLLPAVAVLPGAPWTMVLLGAVPVVLYAGSLSVWAMSSLRGLIASERSDLDRMRGIADSASDILLTARRNGNVTFVTEAAGDALSMPSAALLGDGLFRRIQVADRPAFLTALDDAACGKTASAEFRVATGAGEGMGGHVWVEMRCRLEGGGDSGSPDIVAVLNAIEARKRTETEVRSIRDEAERASIARDRFLAKVSHELRTPLNAIIGFSDILRTANAGEGEMKLPELTAEKRSEYAENIHESGMHLLSVVNDILDLSKIQNGQVEIAPESIDLRELIDSCRRMMDEQLTATGLRLDADLPRSVWRIRADRRALKQIVLNLLSNAAKFSRPEGRIVVGGYRENAGIVVYVADEGDGIASEDIVRLGKPFQQAGRSDDRAREGAGLGLSVVRGLAEQHGGSMTIESELGLGTRVLIRLPGDSVIAPDFSPGPQGNTQGDTPIETQGNTRGETHTATTVPRRLSA